MFFHKFDHILNKCGRFFNPHKGSLPPVSVVKLLSTSDIPNKNPSKQGDSYMPCTAMAHYPKFIARSSLPYNPVENSPHTILMDSAPQNKTSFLFFFDYLDSYFILAQVLY